MADNPITATEKAVAEAEAKKRFDAEQAENAAANSDTSFLDKIRTGATSAFDFVTQGHPLNPLGWASPGLSTLLDPAGMTLPNVSSIYGAFRGDPNAKAKLNENARRNVGMLVGGMAGGLSGVRAGIPGMAAGAAMGAVGGVASPPRDVADLASTAVTGAIPGLFPIRGANLGSAAVTGNIPTKGQFFKNWAKMLPVTNLLNALGLGTEAAVRGENPLESRPMETAARTLFSNVLPGVVSGLGSIAGTGKGSIARSAYDAILGRKAINPFEEKLPDQVQREAANMYAGAKPDLDQVVVDKVRPVVGQRVAKEAPLQRRLDIGLRQEQAQLGKEMAAAKAERAHLVNVFGEDLVNLKRQAAEADVYKAANSLGIRLKKGEIAKELVGYTNDIISKGVALNKDQFEIQVLLSEIGRKQKSFKNIFNPVTGQEDLALDGATKRVQELWRRVYNSDIDSVGIAKQVAARSKGGLVQHPPVKGEDPVTSNVDKAIYGLDSLEDQLGKIEEARLALRLSRSQTEAEKIESQLNINAKIAGIQQKIDERRAEAISLRASLSEIEEMGKKNPAMRASARMLFGQDLAPHQSLGEVNPTVLGDRFLSLSPDPNARQKQLTDLQDGIRWVKEKAGTDAPRYLSAMKNVVRARIIQRTIETKPGQSSLGGRDMGASIEGLSTLFDPDEALHLDQVLRSLELSKREANRYAKMYGESLIRSAGYASAHGNFHMPLVTGTVAGIITVPIPVLNKLLKDPVVGRQFVDWANKGGFQKGTLQNYRALENLLLRLPFNSVSDKVMGASPIVPSASEVGASLLPPLG